MIPRLIILLSFLMGAAISKAADVAIPEKDRAAMKTTDQIEVSGTNDRGGAERFAIHDMKAIRQFITLLTDDRYTAVPKNLKPAFKSLSAYTVQLSAQGAPVLKLRIIGDSILELPDDPMFYVESDSYSANLMAPLLRLR